MYSCFVTDFYQFYFSMTVQCLRQQRHCLLFDGDGVQWWTPKWRWWDLIFKKITLNYTLNIELIWFDYYIWIHLFFSNLSINFEISMHKWDFKLILRCHTALWNNSVSYNRLILVLSTFKHISYLTVSIIHNICVRILVNCLNEFQHNRFNWQDSFCCCHMKT